MYYYKTVKWQIAKVLRNWTRPRIKLFTPSYQTWNKVSRNEGIIKKLKHFLPTPALLMLYYSIVYPHILYGIIIWGSTYTSHLNNLQLIQNKAVRAICSLNWREHVTPCFHRLKILKIKDVAKLEIAKFVHQSVNHSLPMYFQFYFHKVSMTHKRCTRSSSSDKLSIPLYLTNRAQRSIKYQGSKTWNSIPPVIRCLKLKKFSQKYRVQLLTSYHN